MLLLSLQFNGKVGLDCYFYILSLPGSLAQEIECLPGVQNLQVLNSKHKSQKKCNLRSEVVGKAVE
jgi:hypothetical protein